MAARTSAPLSSSRPIELVAALFGAAAKNAARAVARSRRCNDDDDDDDDDDDTGDEDDEDDTEEEEEEEVTMGLSDSWSPRPSQPSGLCCSSIATPTAVRSCITL